MSISEIQRVIWDSYKSVNGENLKLWKVCRKEHSCLRLVTLENPACSVGHLLASGNMASETFSDKVLL